MDLVPYALTSLSDTRLYLGFPNNSKDELIKLFINVATDMIESETGRRFFLSTYTNQRFDGSGEKNVLLPQYPVVSFSGLGKNQAYNNEEDWDLMEVNSYFRDDSAGILTGMERFSAGSQNYRATYTAGYAVIPYDLQFACMKLVKAMFDDQDARGLTSERLGDHQVTFSKVFETDPLFQKVIDKYRRIIL